MLCFSNTSCGCFESLKVLSMLSLSGLLGTIYIHVVFQLYMYVQREVKMHPAPDPPIQTPPPL